MLILRHINTYANHTNTSNGKFVMLHTGHAQINMITEVYAHILDEDRKINAQKFEQAFYTNGDMRMVERQIQQAKAASGELPEQLI